MGSLAIGVVGALAILLAAAGLVVPAMRAGPSVLDLQAVTVEATAEGTYLAVGPSQSPLCTLDPASCAARTEIHLVMRGLPDVPVTARLEGGGPPMELGPLQRHPDGTQRLDWSNDVDQSERSRLVLQVAGLTVHAFAVQASAEPRSLDGPVPASLHLGDARVRLAHSGAVEVSTVAAGAAGFQVPAGWHLVAWLSHAAGDHDLLGPFEEGEDGLVLDARRERVRFTAGDQVGTWLAPMAGPVGDAPSGFPVGAAAL